MSRHRFLSAILFATAQLYAAIISPAASQTNATIQSRQPLELTTRIISQRYCATSASVDTLEMKLQLRYANIGNEKLILYKGNALFYQTKIRQRLSEAAVAKPYEVVMLNARYFDQMPEKIDRASPGRAFIILPPGAVYETEMVVGVGVVGEGRERMSNAITNGEHTLYLIVSTWYESRTLAKELRERWRRNGFLWFDPITSMPLNFTVEQHHPLVKCQ